jgi:hypothetical protein
VDEPRRSRKIAAGAVERRGFGSDPAASVRATAGMNF